MAPCGAHGTAAAGAVSPAGKSACLIAGEGTRFFGYEPMYGLPLLFIYYCLVRVFHPEPQFRGFWHVALGLVGYAAVPALNHMADVDLVLEHAGYHGILPQPAAGGGYAPGVELPGYRRFSLAIGE